MKKKLGQKTASLLLAFMLLLGLCPVSAFAADAAQTAPILSQTLAQELSAMPHPEFGAEWVIFGLARSGHLDKGSEYFNEYYNQVVAYVNAQAAKVNQNGALHRVKCTENSRLIIALSALGRDVTAVGNWNLAAPYEDFAWISGQGLNSVVFTLIALDAAGYTTQTENIRDRCLAYILNRQLPDGGWSYAEEATDADPDMTAMTLQALANYRAKDGISAAVARGLERLSTLQNDDGGYSSYDTVNSESTAQVIVACTALGVDPHTDSRFVKNGRSAVDALLSFYSSQEHGFHHVMQDKDGNPTGVDGMATEQAAYALTAYQRFASGKTALYDMSDVTRDCPDGGHSFGDWTETAAGCTQPGVRTRVCSRCGRSETEELAPALGHSIGDVYEMDDDSHWLLCSVCGDRLQEDLHRYGGDQCAVCSYHKLGGRIQIEVLTRVPDSMAGEEAFATVSAMTDAMLAAACKVSPACTREKSQLLEVSLLIPSQENGQTVWAAAAKEDFPANGKIQVLLPYPMGTNANDNDFVVTHLFTTSDFGKAPGDMESPKVKKTADGLLVTVTGLSPVLISWHTASPSVIDRVIDGVIDGVRTGDGAHILLWLCAMSLSAGGIVVLRRQKSRAAKKKP